MSITGKELAKRMNLSEATISLALNNKPGISTKKRKEVVEMAKKLGYDFSRIPVKEELLLNKGTIYMIIYRKHGTIIDDSSLLTQLSEGVRKGCHSMGYHMNTSYVESGETVNTFLEEIKRLGGKGIILVGTEMKQEDFLPFQRIQMPIVLVDCYFSDITVDCVHINNTRSAYLATNHLIRETSSHPGYLHSSYKTQNFYERKQGYTKAIHSAGLSSSRSIIHRLAPTLEGAYSDMLSLLKSGVLLAKAYFADNDLIAGGVIKALKEYGYSVPEDIGIIGFGNISLCTLLKPQLSTIEVEKEYMGLLAAKRLVDIMHSKKHVPIRIEVETKIVERASVCKKNSYMDLESKKTR